MDVLYLSAPTLFFFSFYIMAFGSINDRLQDLSADAGEHGP